MDTIIKLQRPRGYHPKQGARVEVRFEKGRELSGDQGEPFIFQIVPDPSNPEKLTWKTEKISKQKSDEANENIREIILKLDKGMKQVDIAKEVNCSSQYISSVKNKAIKDGILNKHGCLTEEARKTYCKDEADE